MKKVRLLPIALLSFALLLSGCKKEETIKFDDYSQFKEISTQDYVEVGPYKDLTISTDTLVVTDTDIDTKVSQILYDLGFYVETPDKAIATGNQVTISLSGTIDGKINDGFTSD